MPKKSVLLAWLLLLVLLAACAPGGGGGGSAAQRAVIGAPVASLPGTPTPVETPPTGTAAAAPALSGASRSAPLGSAGAAPSAGQTPLSVTSTVSQAMPAASSSETPQPPSGAATAADSRAGSSGAIPAFSHIFVIVMENKEATAIVGSPQAPFINQLAASYGRAANYYGVSHPSLPNYLALTGGDTFGVASDCTSCTVNAENLVDQLERAGHSWKAYMDSMPEACSLAPAAGNYAKKHNPFVYYDDIRTSPQRCKNVVPLAELQTDLQNNTVPDFVWITPDQCHDMHNCTVKTGDAWLQQWVTLITASPAWQNNGALFITFDEGSSSAGCCGDAQGGQVDTLVVSPLSRRGFVSQTPYSHYALLRTIDDAWGMPPLGKAGESQAQPMADFFAKP